MFLGHFAVGFALKRTAPRASLGLLIAAPQFLDLLWPAFLLLGWERVHIVPNNPPLLRLAFDSYPISHSLLMSGVWGVLLAGTWFARGPRTAARRGVAMLIALAVVSHWVLDWITHRPDMPLAPGAATKVGLGLWYSTAATVTIEGAMFVTGVWIYARATRAVDRLGGIGLWLYVAVLAIIYVASLTGPPPPDPRSLAIVSTAIWVLPLWAWRLDKHRRAAPA